MSLLMDALKKAELAKRQAPKDQAEPSPTAAPSQDSPLELAPLGAAPEPLAGEPSMPPSAVEAEAAKPGSLPELPSTLELLDQEFMDEALVLAQRKSESAKEKEPALVRTETFTLPTSPATPALESGPQQRAVADAQRERKSVQNLFEAKQTPAPPRKTFAIMVGLFSLLAAAGIGIYFWLQMQSRSGLVPANGAAMPIAPPPSRPIIATPSAPLANTPAAPPSQMESEPSPPAAPLRQAPPPAESAIHVTASKLRVDPTLDTAFNALQNGDLATAQAAYEQALKNDPKNADALHGLATIHLRQGKPELAQDYYLRALEADPKDALAQANLIGMDSQIDPVQSESRLKLLLAAQPSSPFLHFYLGNLYARQGRWAEAQQEYYKAMSGEPDNPDYLFNLAVSLDQLHQAKLASQYYGQALSAADKQSAGFDKQQVADRLKKLRP